jgi:uncharacterized protein
MDGQVPDFAPPDIPEFEPFWEAATRGVIALPGCGRCGRLVWYPLPGLPCGHTGPPRWQDLPGTGTIHTWTRVFRPFLPHGSRPPYTLVLVDLDEGQGARLVSVLVGPGSDSPQIGARVRVEPVEVTARTLPAFVLT